MIQKSNLLLLLFSFLLSSVSAQVDLSNKIRYYKGELADQFQLVNVIKPTSYNYAQINDASVCRADQCTTPSAVTVFLVSFANYDLGYTHVCICDNAVLNVTQMSDNIGRVPYQVRKYVQSYTAASIGKYNYAAFASEGKIVIALSGDGPEVFIHESGHVFDATNGGLSTKDAYYNALRNDICVPGEYAATNTVEDFAELTIVWVGLVMTGRPNPSCLSQALDYYSQILPRSTILSQLSAYSNPVTSAPTPCTLAIRQTFSKSYQSGGITYSEYSAVFINNGAKAVPTSDLAVQLSGAQITQIYSLEQGKSGAYMLASYASGIEAGQQYSWGYTVQGSSPLSVSFITPSSCSSSAPSPSSAPTSAPATRAPTSAPVTPAPTSAPATPAPTSAPVTPAPTSAPATRAPTSAPVTPAPTSAPVTPAPTSAPVTPAPTSAPVTRAPTSAPATQAPTSAPVTPAPTSAPATPAPTSAPVTPAPTPSSTSSSCAFGIRQTLANTWISNGITYSQYDVVYRNAGSEPAAAVAQLGGAVITQIWIVEHGANGYYYLPSYQSTIAPNAEFSWGYIAQTSSPITIRLIC